MTGRLWGSRLSTFATKPTAGQGLAAADRLDRPAPPLQLPFEHCSCAGSDCLPLTWDWQDWTGKKN